MPSRWEARLARPIVLRDGTELTTLGNARAYILEKLSETDQHRNAWQRAIEKLMRAASSRKEIEKRPARNFRS